jgi:phosphatidylserine/phosphatidylglycerophosphate/cardiolipin synthase-like enzyme
MGHKEMLSRVTISTFLALFFTPFLTMTTHAAAVPLTSGSVEVVQSFPIETTLETPGIRLTQDVWVEMISGAQRTIDLEEFYVNNQAGQSLQPVIDAIKAAAGRGVQVRLIVDAGYYKTYPDVPNEFAQTANIQVKTIDFSSLGGIQHSKYFVIDQSRTFLGSANLDWLALTHIHEVGLKITNSDISTSLESVFETDWQAGSALGQYSTGPSANAVPDFFTTSDFALDANSMNFVASPQSDDPTNINDSLTAITQLIGAAQNTLKLQVYEFDTSIYKSSEHWHVLDDAIRAAAARNVQVQILVDKTALKAGKKDLEALAQVPNIQLQVVTVPEWSGGPIPYARVVHSKYFIVDGTSAWVGTENWEETYFTGSRNVGLVLNSAEIAGQLDQIFSQVWSSAYLSSP